MLKRLALAVFFLIPVACSGEQGPAPIPGFVPIVLDQNNYTDLINALGELKYKDAAPIIAGLVRLEQKAIADAKK